MILSLFALDVDDGKVRLEKAEEPNNIFNTIKESIESWLIAHATLCLIVFACLLIALFVTLIFALIGVSAVESGTVYNGMDKII